MSVPSDCGAPTGHRNPRSTWSARSPARRGSRPPTASPSIDIDVEQYWERPEVELPALLGRFLSAAAGGDVSGAG